MRTLIQRVSEASVSINGCVKSQIGKGLLVFIGIEEEDNQQDIDWLCSKIPKLRIFNDENGLMNLSVKDVAGNIMIISQFTLHASTQKGNRPSYFKAAKPEISFPLYEKFIQTLEQEFQQTIATGEFGADMKILLINDGPVTIFIDTKDKE